MFIFSWRRLKAKILKLLSWKVVGIRHKLLRGSSQKYGQFELLRKNISKIQINQHYFLCPLNMHNCNKQFCDIVKWCQGWMKAESKKGSSFLTVGMLPIYRVLLKSKLSKPSKLSIPVVYFLVLRVLRSKPKFFHKNWFT